MTTSTRLMISAALVVGSMAAGYVSRRRQWVSASLAKTLMTLVMCLGYSSVQFLAIWRLPLARQHAWLPVLGGLNIVLMALVSLALARWLTRDRNDRGLFAVAGGAGNNGITMGGLVLFGLYGENGLGMMSVYCLMWMPAIVAVLYPIARWGSPTQRGGSLAGLMLRSILDWRSIGLPVVLAGLLLNCAGVARPPLIARLHLVEILAFATTAVAYFSIGLRVRFSRVRELGRFIWALAAARFVLSPLVAAGLVQLTALTPWPIGGMVRDVIIIESAMPVAVATVAIADMFDLRPDRGSALFVVNTLMFLAGMVPLLFWLFGRGCGAG